MHSSMRPVLVARPTGRWWTVPMLAAAVACGGSVDGDANTGSDGPKRRDTEVKHEECDLEAGSAKKLDANGDQRPDITLVFDGTRELCRAVDLNFDGSIDSWVYRNEQGQIRRRELDYDRDGRVDEIVRYENGVVTEKQRASTLAHRLDTWEYYENGRLARAERDSDGDGVVDQWWEYKASGCPLIHSDVNGDGRPDPGSTVDYCKETGYVPPERMGPSRPKSPTFERPGTLPEELENRERDEGEKANDSNDAKEKK